MPVTNYYSAEGRMLGSGSGGGRTDYLTDALGSVTATVSQSPAVVNTYRYKPYGTQLSKTGAGADPKFTWVGSHGYRETGRPSSDKYVRARHYGTRQAAWTTTDPLWPKVPSYGYCEMNSMRFVDPGGLNHLDVDVNAFINNRKFGRHISLLRWPDIDILLKGLKEILGDITFNSDIASSTDRGPYDYKSHNRGKDVISIESAYIGSVLPRLNMAVGNTTVYLNPGGLAWIEVFKDKGHYHKLYHMSGFEKCKNSWIRVHTRYCAALLPNVGALCVDARYTVNFCIAGKDKVKVQVKDIYLERFPDFDAWVSVDSVPKKNLFHSPETWGWTPHPFGGMAFSNKLNDVETEVSAQTPTDCA